ncbi:MAG TPA: asparagine synthase-related protein [Candidatus Eremiobacteraceae bacterium]|nr:asparagine synthase-related protein [Candidatus Eremiobacteraceae bacterium]
MPGIVVAAGPRAADALTAIARERYVQQTFVPQAATGGLLAGASAYETYPFAVAKMAGCTAVLEGAAYGERPAELEQMLGALAETFAGDPAAARAQAETWASKSDGDFVLLVARDDGAEAIVVNDRLGRLPLYMAARSGSAAIAREIKAVRAACGAGDVDRHALAQMLLFTFPLGLRTLHAHISRVPEASSLHIDAGGRVDVRSYYHWDFEALHAGGVAPDAAELADRFAERTAAIVDWGRGRSVILGLSGGLDSRAVAAALTRSKTSYSAFTFTSRRKKAAEETDTSAQLARALGIPWEALVLAPPTWEDERAMAVMRDGTSNVALSFLTEYFRVLTDRFGPGALHFTGDGGDRALPDLRAEVRIADRDGFLEYRLANAIWTVAEAAALVCLPRDEVVDAIRAHFASYPEKDASFHNVRFMSSDWAMNRLFCGEDRNRSFLWTATPFYSQSFFEAAMRAPLRRKRHYALYADVLRALDPRVVKIAKSNWGHAVDSPLVRLTGWRDAIGARFALSAKRGLASRSDGAHGDYGTPARNPEYAELAKRFDGPGFDRERLAKTANRGLAKLQYHMLATALLYISSVWSQPNGRSAGRPV